MIIPVRCFSCGKPIAEKWDKYKEEVEAGKNPEEVLDKLGINRYCCRRMFLSHIDLIDEIAKFKRF